MKPLGKAMKTANYNGEEKEGALKDLMATYRATPNINSGISPGDMIFRHGYAMDFSKRQAPDDEEKREAINREQEARKDKDNKENESRRTETVKIGDKVLNSTPHSDRIR